MKQLHAFMILLIGTSCSTICSFPDKCRCVYLFIRKPNWGLRGLLGNLSSVQISVASCVWRWRWWIAVNRIRPLIFHYRVKNWGRKFDQASRMTVQWMHTETMTGSIMKPGPLEKLRCVQYIVIICVTMWNIHDCMCSDVHDSFPTRAYAYQIHVFYG